MLLEFHEKSIRIFWLDNLKALGIFLVILGHIIPDSYLRQYIFSFHVPLFFFVSGYLFDRSKYNFRQFFERKFRTIIIPYLFFAILSFLFWFFIVRNLSISGTALKANPLQPLIGIFYGIGSENWRVPMNIALWFLPCLFVVEIIFYITKIKYLFISFAFIGYLVTFLPFRLPWSFDVALTAIVFYGFGNLSKDKSLSKKTLPFLFILHVAFCFLNRPVDMNNLVYGNIFFFYISSCAGVLFYSSIFKLIGSNRITKYIGRNTIILIGLVGITWFIMNGAYYLLFKTKIEQSNNYVAFIVSIFQIILTVPAIYCINRWLPFILGRHKS